MINLSDFGQFLNESIRYLNVDEVFEWLEKRKDRTFIALDTETTGLKGPRKEQLTQVSAVSYRFNYDELSFSEIGYFNEDIKLNPDTLGRMKEEDPDLMRALKFNRYSVDQENKSDEQEALDSLYDFINQYPEDSIIVIQNAPFDMPMINIRRKLGGIKREIFDSLDLFTFLLVPTLEKLAETRDEMKVILDRIGLSYSGKYYSTSLPNIAKGMGVDSKDSHNSLVDCRYMIKTLEKALDFLKQNSEKDLKKYTHKRYLLDRKRKTNKRW